MEELESLKFSFIEENLMIMLNQLSKNQNFLRYIQYLSENPLMSEIVYDKYDEEIKDKNGNPSPIQQPDIITNAEKMIENNTIFLTLFNPTIITEEKIYIFLSPIKGKNEEGEPLFANEYIFDFIIPYTYMIMDGTQLRMFRIASEVCRSWDNQDIGAGLGKMIMVDWKTAPVNAEYQGMKLYFKIDDSAFTD